MLAPKRKCCGERHWESDWECPNRDLSDQARKDFTVVERPKKEKPAKVAKEPPKKRGPKRNTGPLKFDPELDRPDSKATDKSKIQMRSRRKKPEKHREYMKNYMQKYRAKKAQERKEQREKEAADNKSVD